jgi:PKD repeat protein
MKKILTLAFFLMFFSALRSQNNPTILLNNGVIETEKNTETFRVVPGESYHGRIVRVIQFSEIPDLLMHQRLKSFSIHLADYIPNNAYYAVMPERITGNTLATLGIETVIIPGREFKLSMNLYNGTIPEYALLPDNRIEIVLMPYQHIDIDEFLSTLELPDFVVKRIVYPGHFIEAVCTQSDIEQLVHHPYVQMIFEADAPAEKDNNTAITSHRVNTVNGMDAHSTSYTGVGVIVSHGDDGAIGPHIDFRGRLDISGAGASTGDHGDHVAGTIFGAGNRDPLGRGMAPGAEILYYSYPDNLDNSVVDYQNKGIRITSSSYSNGCNAGYTAYARFMDESSYNNSGLLHVFSAGNSGTSNCSYGAGSGWGNITGGHKVGKNVIAVGNVTRLDVINTGSSRGPAHDGRIKPEVCAVGTSVYSTTDPHVYTVKTGTSMACPGVSGSMAVLYEAYQDITSQPPIGGMMKALLMNGADDIGNPGPDFIHGFGRINVSNSLRMIENNWIIRDSIVQNSVNTHNIIIPNDIQQMRVMVYWTDPPAFTGAAIALVNNLDMTIDYGATTYLPLVLNHTPNAALLNQNAVPGVDNLNNVEQIVINNPASGIYTVNIDGTLIPTGQQEYFIVYYFEDQPPRLTYPVGGESFVPGTTEIIRWDAHLPASDFSLQYSSDNGLSWQSIATNINSNLRYYSWTVPTLISSEMKIRLLLTGSSDESDAFTVIPVPTGLAAEMVCPDNTKLVWDSVPGAQGYVVYKLGAMYMDSVGYTTDAHFTVTPVNGYLENWYSVSSVAPGDGIGRRAYAIRVEGVNNCILNDDLELTQIISPGSAMIPDCINDSTQLKVRVKNAGLQNITQFDLKFQLNGGTVVSENVQMNILPGEVVDYQSSQFIQLTGVNTNMLTVWVEMSNDQNSFNDTLIATLQVYPSVVYSIPFVRDFEDQTICSTAGDCESIVCSLTSGLLNADNLVFDDIDWRVNNGSTPSQSTGPSVDNTLGTTAGKYVYLEATTCFNKTGDLYIACIDLTTAVNPVLEFYHHRLGDATGPLTVEIYYDGVWLELIPPITGATGNNWEKYEAGLMQYTGNIIALRFRGATSGSWQGDIALDDISIIEYSQLPVADFTATPLLACPGDEINLYDLSNGYPTAWQWGISPSTYTLQQGTTLMDQNPIVSFTSDGLYTITLIAENSFGADTIVYSNLIEILPEPNTPLTTDDTVIFGNQATLMAFSNGTIHWYDDLFTPVAFHTGDTFVTNPLYATQTYYVAAMSSAGSMNSPELIYYSFDNPGNVVENLALNPVGNNPAPINGSGLSIGGTGRFGLALQGTGGNSSSDIINTGWNTNLNGSFTISFWTSEIVQTGQLMYLWGDQGAANFRCYTNGTVAGPGNWIVRGGGLPDLLIPGGATMNPNLIHVVYDAVNGDYKAYVESVMVNSVTAGVGNIMSGSGFTVGGYAATSGLYGLIDEFRIYNRALSEQEIMDAVAYTGASCVTDRVPVAAYVNLQAYEAELVEIISPAASSCTDNTEYISVTISNNGTQTISGNLTASYIVNGNTPVTEPVLIAVPAGDSILFTFNTPVVLNLTDGDTILNITTYVNHIDDIYQANDTVHIQSELTFIPPQPAGINDTVLSGGTAVLQAVSNFDLRWYATDNPSDMSVLDTGAVLTVPNVTVSTPYYVAAHNGSHADHMFETTFNMGSGCGSGNMFNLTPLTEDIVIYGLTITPRVTNSSMPVNVYYKSGTYAGFETNQAAWTHLGSYNVNATASTPVYLNCHEFTLLQGQTYGIYVQYDASYTTLSSVQTISDNMLQLEAGAGLCASFGSVYSPRMFNGRIHYKSDVSYCESPRTEVWAIVSGFSTFDAGVIDITNPAVSLFTGIPENVDVVIKNFGTEILYQIPVAYSVDGGNPVQENWNGVLLPDSTVGYVFNTALSQTSPFTLCAYTELTNDVLLNNDTTCIQISVLPLMYDASLIEIIDPQSLVVTGDQVFVQVKVKNLGTQTITQMELSYDIDAGVPTVESWTGSLFPDDELIYTFTVPYTSASGNYIFCAQCVMSNDQNILNDRICMNVTGTTSLPETENPVFTLGQNIPNPCQSSSVVIYQIPNDGMIHFMLTDISGKVLFEQHQMKQGGHHEILLDVSVLAAGIYFYSLEFDGIRLYKKLMVE